jgi:hypothetical protein
LHLDLCRGQLGRRPVEQFADRDIRRGLIRRTTGLQESVGLVVCIGLVEQPVLEEVLDGLGDGRFVVGPLFFVERLTPRCVGGGFRGDRAVGCCVSASARAVSRCRNFSARISPHVVPTIPPTSVNSTMAAASTGPLFLRRNFFRR